jgi:hypothetical protein
VSFHPGDFAACYVYTSFIGFFESKMIPEYSEKYSAEYRDSE